MSKDVKIKVFGLPMCVPMPHRYYLHGVSGKTCVRKLNSRDPKAKDLGLSSMGTTYRL